MVYCLLCREKTSCVSLAWSAGLAGLNPLAIQWIKAETQDTREVPHAQPLGRSVHWLSVEA